MKKHHLSRRKAIVMNLCKEYGFNFMPYFNAYEQIRQNNIKRQHNNNASDDISDDFKFNSRIHEVIEGYSL